MRGGAFLLSAWLLSCGCGRPLDAPAAAGQATPKLVVERDELSTRHLLSGELAASEGLPITVPRTSSWQVQIRWMAEDGTRVEAGDKLLELDNGNFVSDLEDKRLAVAEKQSEIEQKAADALAAEAEAVFALEQRQAEVVKARIKATVPADLIARREYEERQLALAKAKLALEKAQTDLEAKRLANQAERAQLELDLAKQEREIAAAEQAIRALSVVAPRAGLVLISDHPWEPRKIREGDKVWVGFAVMTLPDLARLRVELQLSDVDDGRLRVGDEVGVTVDAFPDEALTGKVSSLTPLAREMGENSLRRFFAGLIELSRLPPRFAGAETQLRPGMSVKIEAKGPVHSAVLVAPRAGLDLEVEPPQARLASGGRRPVELGPCDAQRCVVLTGLEAGVELAPAGGEKSQ